MVILKETTRWERRGWGRQLCYIFVNRRKCKSSPMVKTSEEFWWIETRKSSILRWFDWLLSFRICNSLLITIIVCVRCLKCLSIIRRYPVHFVPRCPVKNWGFWSWRSFVLSLSSLCSQDSFHWEFRYRFRMVPNHGAHFEFSRSSQLQMRIAVDR